MDTIVVTLRPPRFACDTLAFDVEPRRGHRRVGCEGRIYLCLMEKTSQLIGRLWCIHMYGRSSVAKSS